MVVLPFLRLRNRPDEVSASTIGFIVASELSELASNMEYNHQESVDFNPEALFWAVTITISTATLAVLLIIVALAQALIHRSTSAAARGKLGAIQDRLNQLALGLDLSRIDMVAVLGGDRGTSSQAAEADQRLYEAALVTAWRQVQVLDSAPRAQQRRPEWVSRVENLDRLVRMLSQRDTDVAQRALELVRS